MSERRKITLNKPEQPASPEADKADADLRRKPTRSGAPMPRQRVRPTDLPDDVSALRGAPPRPAATEEPRGPRGAPRQDDRRRAPSPPQAGGPRHDPRDRPPMNREAQTRRDDGGGFRDTRQAPPSARPEFRQRPDDRQDPRNGPRFGERTEPRSQGRFDGRFDGHAPRWEPPVATPRQAPDDGRVRLSKLMSEQGLSSRREADDWIAEGWVRVDGEVVTELGTRIFPTQTITIDEAARTEQSQRVTILLNKPIGYVSAQAEDGHEPAVVLITPDNRWEGDKLPWKLSRGHLHKLAPAGRLDIDSTGLLVMTQDGRIARHLIGEDALVEKEYLVRVIAVDQPDVENVSAVVPEEVLEHLRHGLWLDERPLKPAKVSWQNEQQLRFVLREGKKRQIRRMCELVGLKVVGLRRVRMGQVVLGKLPVGQWRFLRPDERF